MHPDLNEWLPEPQVRTCHRRSADVDADRLWDAAGTVLLSDAPVLGRAVRWRIPGTSSDVSFRSLFRRYPFAVIAEGRHWSVSGMCGRIWTLQRDYPQIESADDFLAWQEPNTVRVLLAHWIEQEGAERSAIVSESRIQPVDGRARLRLRALWALVGHFDALIEGEALGRAAQRAEETEARDRARVSVDQAR
jgi:hypothetical protein